MIDLDKAVTISLRKNGENFEVLVDLDKALEFRRGKVSLEEVLVTEDVYRDAKKATKINENEMEKFFNTKDLRKISEEIVKEGFIHLTTEHRNKLKIEKRKKIIELIHRNAVDSKSGFPHPITRIENAMEEAKVRIDEMKSAEEQLEEILDKLREVIPIKFEVKKLQLIIPAKYGSVHNIIKQFGKILNEDWSSGNLSLTVEIPGGMVEEFYDKLNSLTHGEVESKEI